MISTETYRKCMKLCVFFNINYEYIWSIFLTAPTNTYRHLVFTLTIKTINQMTKTCISHPAKINV